MMVQSGNTMMFDRSNKVSSANFTAVMKLHRTNYINVSETIINGARREEKLTELLMEKLRNWFEK